MPTAPAPVGFIPSIPRPFVPILPYLEQDDAFGQPTPVLVPFRDFYCQSNGNNINAGSTQDGNAIYTSTNGNWSTVTNVFTPTDGSNPVASGVSAGMYASVYIDGATTAVYIALITNVTDKANGLITVSNTVIYGTAPSTSATTRSVKVGGAWLGPSGASAFPLGLTGGMVGLSASGGYRVRLNFKNDQTYTLTSNMAFTSGAVVYQGFSLVSGDGGKATFNMNAASGGSFSDASANSTFIDLIFTTTATSNSAAVVSVTAINVVFFRCVFHDSRGFGCQYGANGGALYLIECETYSCNKSNSANLGGCGTTAGGNLFCSNCYHHDHTSGVNAHCCASTNGGIILVNSILDNATGCGAVLTSNTGNVIALNSDFYNITKDAIQYTNANAGGFWVLINNNFVKIGGRVLNSTSTTLQSGIMFNNGRSDIGVVDNFNIVDTHTDVFYPYGITPWLAPNTGDFSKVLAAAISSGRGAFTQTDGTNTGTLSYPDIGATQAQLTVQAFANTNTQTLPYGYVNHFYAWKWYFGLPATVSLVSGSLPTGLQLVQGGPNFIYILGTPTVVGTYDFVLQAASGTSTGTSPFEIAILDDPDEGVGGVGGG